MIDLHIHTTYSDGTDSLKDVLIKSEKLSLKTISITDHQNIDAYRELKSQGIKQLFRGKIITGCEFYVPYNKSIIEILGYNFDVDVIDEYLKVFNSPEQKKLRSETKHNKTIKKLDELGFVYDGNILEEHKYELLYFKFVYEELIKYKENFTKIDEDCLSTLTNFFRKGVANPGSKLFVDNSELYPTVEDIIKLIHKAKGVAFLAHPFVYGFKDTKSFLETIYEEHEFDGIEVYYTTHTDEQTKYLLNFAKERNLLISGGSDYHGDNKPNHGLGNLGIDEKILDDWPVLNQ